MRLIRILMILLPAVFLAACGEGDGKQSILNTPAPPIVAPPANCNLGIGFEDACPAVTFTDFEGGVASVVDNPDQGTLNPSEKVGQMQKFAATSGLTFGGSTIGLPSSLNIAAGSSFTMKVWSQRSVRVLFQPEPQGPGNGIEVTHGGTGWEELTFSLPSISGTVSGITLIFDNGTLGAAATDPNNWTFYFDDITVVPPGTGGGGGGTFSAITFDDAGTTYTLTGFGGAEDSSVQTDPAGGTNQVVRVNRAAGAEVFAGTTVSTGANNSVPTIPLDASNTQMTVRVYSQAAGIPVRLKIEDASDPTISVETEATTTAANTWETLTFDFANEVSGTAAFNAAATYNKITIFFNFGAAGAPAETYYFDDIDVGTGSGGGGGGGFAAITFDDAGTTYTLTGFGGAEDSSVQTDPAGGTNQVVRVNRAAGAEVFAGTTVSTGANNSVPTIPLDASNTQMTVRVYSQAAGIPVRLKIEDASDPTISVETEATTTAANTWETLTFDFANEVSGTAAFNAAATYNKITIFFNFGAAGAPAETYYFDDIDVGTGSGGGGGGGFAAITFDDAGTTYTLTGFGGAEDSTVAADPAGGSNMVGRVVKSATAQLWAGTTVSTGANESIATIPLDAANTQMTVRVYSPVAGIPIRLKIEDASDPTITVETEAMTTGVNTWETLTFDFANEAAGTAAFNPASTYNKVSIFFNFGTDGASGGGGTFFFDDIDVVTGGGAGGGTFSGLSFDDAGTTYTFTGFGGAEDSSLTTDPTGGTNMVVRVNRAAGAEIFAGTTISTGANNSVPRIPLDAANTQMSVRVYSPAAGIPVRLKIEDSSNPAVSVETEVLTTVANTWETLTFNFLNNVPGTAAFDPNATYDKVTIFFNFGAAGAPAQTYYFDDILVVAGNGGGGGGGGSSFTAITFDDAGTTYTLTDFGGNASTVTNDPAGGTNMVVQVVKSNTAQLWAGTTISTEANDAVPTIPLDASNTQMTVRVYSPDAGIPVRLKIEDASDPTITVETEAMTTVTGAWETLTFDFANEAAGTAAFNPAATYNKISIFFNFGTDGATAGEKTYYFDDIDVGAGSGGGSSYAAITFDDAGTTYTLTGFGGAEDSTVAADPAGGSNMVGRVVKSATAQLWAGTTVSTGANESIPTLPLDASNTQMTVRVYSPVAGIPIRLKIEDASDPTITVETEAMTTGVNTWETLTFDFANEAAGTSAFNPAATYNKVSIFFNFGTDGASGGGGTFFFDDIDVGAGSGGGAGGSSYAAITFDDAGTTYTLTGFGGAEDSTVAADPAGGSNMVGRVVKSATAQLWAGTTVSTGANESIPTLPLDASNTQMTVLVYSPVAGIPIRLKIEDASDPTITVETEAMTTGVNTWETLTFDFANEAAGTSAFNPAATYNKVSIFFNFGTDGASGGGGTFFFDDIDVGAGSGGGGGGGGGGSSSNFVNGDFETGDFTGWTLFQDPPGGGSIAVDSSGQGGRAGTVARLVAAGSDIVGTNDVIIGQVALAAGTISPGDTIDVSFDLYGSLTGAGGVVFVEIIFLDGNGSDNGRNFVGPAAPYTPTSTWTTHMGTVTAGTTVGGGSASVAGGVTLELKAACGAIVGGCGVDASFDNVTFTIN